MVYRVEVVTAKQATDLNVNTALFTKATVQKLTTKNVEVDQKNCELNERLNTSTQQGILLSIEHHATQLKIELAIEKEKRIEAERRLAKAQEETQRLSNNLRIYKSKMAQNLIKVKFVQMPPHFQRMWNMYQDFTSLVKRQRKVEFGLKLT